MDFFTESDCREQAKLINFENEKAKEDFIADCQATVQDNTEKTSAVLDTGAEDEGVENDDFFKKNKNIIVVALIVGGLYYAYTKGMFR